MDLTDKLATERRGRLAAERLLDLKSKELFAANRKLSQHALTLSDQIIEQRDETARLKEHTEQVKADLQRAEEHVEVVERRLWDSVETIGDGFAVFDAQDRLVAANTAWLSIYEYSKHIGPGTLYLEVLRIAIEEGHIDLQGTSAGAWIGMMLERWDAPSSTDPQEVLLTSGQWYRLVDRRSRDGDMVCLAQNITTLKERERELQVARHRAEAANRAKSAFLANMSHELRTPMNGVVAMAEMLLETEMEDEQHLYVSTIKSSGEALLEIINHVLDFSKMEAERLVLRPEPFDLERLLHEVVTLLGPTARDKNLQLHVDYDLFSPTRLVGDAMRLRQILINLVGNAVKFTEEGHVLIRVIGYDDGESGWSLHLTVEDTGIGIPHDMQEHIFGSFSQVESETNRKFEGTGLGLAITRQLVQLMGGSIWVESEPGEGACFGFRVTLPAAEPAETLLPRVDTTIGNALVVAPDGYEAVILCRQLEQLGLEVTHVTKGSDALTQVREQESPQITLIDDALSDTRGTELAEALEEANCPSGRLLICAPGDAARLSAHRDGAEFPRGVHAILTRPMLRRDLFEAMARLPDATARRSARVGASAPLLEAKASPEAVSERSEARSQALAQGDPAAPASTGAVPEPEIVVAPEPAASVDAPSRGAFSHACVEAEATRTVSQAIAGPQATFTGTPDDHGASEGPVGPGSEVDAPSPVTDRRMDGPQTPRPALSELGADRSTTEAGAGGPRDPEHRPQVALFESRRGADAPASDSAPKADAEPLPVVQGQGASAPVASSAQHEQQASDDPPPASARRPMRVLAAEDNKTNRFVLDKLLGPLQIDLHFAVDGQDAVDKHAELDPDLILMDISMPRMDGKAAARAIRAREAERTGQEGLRVPIVAMTAHALQGDKEEILASGIDRYMTKPLKRAQVTEQILDHCPSHCLHPHGEAAATASAG